MDTPLLPVIAVKVVWEGIFGNCRVLKFRTDPIRGELSSEKDHTITKYYDRLARLASVIRAKLSDLLRSIDGVGSNSIAT